MSAAASVATAAYPVERLREDFPILREKVHGKDLVYLDNANTTQKPRAVLSALQNYYEHENSNIHRGTHRLSEIATEKYEGARATVRRFINAAEEREIVFVRGATEAINLVARTFGDSQIKAGDEILITHLEHHSNIVPWQLLCERSGAKLVVAPINDAGEIIVEEFAKRLSGKTKLAAFGHVSNALGTVNPVRKLTAFAHAAGAAVLVDGAQAAPHGRVDVQEIGCDFYAFSGHKMYGPTGIGALYGRAAWLEKLPPFHGGGDMILSVSFEKTEYNAIPWKFEAGTANIAGAIGLGAAVDYLEATGLDAIAAWEHELLVYATNSLQEISGLRIIGTSHEKAAVISFVLDGVHPHDIGTILDRDGIAIRTGHHCAQPVMDRFNIPATAHASFGLYNTKAEIDALVAGVYKVQKMFA